MSPATVSVIALLGGEKGGKKGAEKMVGARRLGRVRWYGGEVLMTKYWSSEWDGRDVCRDVRRDEGQEREADEHVQNFRYRGS